VSTEEKRKMTSKGCM